MNNLGGPLFTWEIWMNRVSGGKKRTLQDWRLIIESLTETNMNLDPWQAVPISNKYSGLTLNHQQGSDSEGSSPEGIAPQPSSHVEGPNGSFQERPEHAPNVPWTGQIGTDLVDESLLMIESLQQTVYTQSAQNFSLRAELASARSHIQTMEGLFERLGVGAGPRRSQRGDEGASGSRNTRRSSRRRTRGPSDEDENI
nr:hypothetical protein CFP56_27356 [Quercus suber]